MRLPLLLAICFGLHLLVGLRLVPQLPPGPGVALGGLLVLSAALMPLSILARRLARPPTANLLSWLGLLALGFFSSLLVLTLLREALLLLVWLAGLAGLVGRPTATAWQRTSAQFVPVLAIALTILGAWNARRTARVVTVDVPLVGLPAALHHFSIVQISDIHVGPTIRRGYVQAIVDAVNRQQPDLVAVTGDLVDGPVQELGPHVAPLSQLRSRHGSFFVTGNHEYYAGAHPWLAEVRRLGLHTLLNQHVVLEHEGARLVLAGVTDFSAHHFDRSHRSDPVAAGAGAPADAAVRILLAHQPRSAPGAAAAGFDLQLSGHTHGGQFLPWRFFVRFQQPFTAGLHRVGRMWLYVSRGTGYWGPPKRLGAPSEITRIRLVAA
jgi:predicted MPP superfamily phosphohydrolase